MAKKAEIIVSVNTKQAVKSVADLNGELTGTLNTLGDLEAASEALSEQLRQAEVGSERYNELNAALIEVNREIRELELNMEALDSEQMASEFGSFTAGLADTATAAIALSSAMGITDESSIQMIETLSQGMAIAQGFRGGIEGIISFQKLLKNSTLIQNALQAKSIALTAADTAGKGANTAAVAAQTTATGGASVAMGILNAVMMANPVFLLIGGITALVGAMVLFGGASADAKKEQARLNMELENTQRSAEAASAALDRLAAREEDSINNQVTLLQKQRELLEARSELTEEEEERLASINEQINNLEIDKVENTIDTASKKIEDLGDVMTGTFDLIRSSIDVTDIEDGVNDINYDSLQSRNDSLEESFKSIMSSGFSEENVASQIKRLEALRSRVTNYQNQLAKGDTFLGSAESEEFQSVIDNADSLASTLDNIIGSADEMNSALGDRETTQNLQTQQEILEQIKAAEEAAAEAERRRKEFLKQQEAFRAQLLKVRQELELQAIEDVNDRAVRAVEQRLENDLAKIKGNTEVAIQLRTALEEKAQNDIAKIRDDARAKELKKEQDAALQASLARIKTEQDELAELELAYEEINNVRIGNEQAEIQAVQDKYFRLKELAKQHGQDLVALKEEEERQIKEIQARFAEEAGVKEQEALDARMEKIQMVMEIVAQTISDIMGIVQDVINEQAADAAAKREEEFEAGTESLKAQLANREISQKQFDAKMALIEQQKEQKELAAKRKAFQQQKAMAIVNAVMSTAQAVIQGMANAFPLNIVMSALAGAVGAAQIGVIASQKFRAARGGVVPGMGPSNIDSVDAMLAPGETVINAQSSSMFPNLLSTINEAGGGIPLVPDTPDGGTTTQSNDNVFSENNPTPVVKAVIVESELTETQKRVDRFERRAEFG